MSAPNDDARKGLMDVRNDGGPRTVLKEEDPQARIDFRTLGRVGPALIVFAVCIVLPYLVPQLEDARGWKPGDTPLYWNLFGRYDAEFVEEQEKAEEIDELADEALEVAEAAEDTPPPVARPLPPVEPPPPPSDGDPDAVAELPAYPGHPDDDLKVREPLELFTGHELDRFFRSLGESESRWPDAITRVVHYGDSAISVDGIPGAIRRRMQGRFGDAGHGFHLLEPSSTSYRHREVQFQTNATWRQCFIIRKCVEDGHYGLGGTTFWARKGSESSFTPHPKKSAGVVSRFELWYAGSPEGGALEVRVDGGQPERIDTKADALVDRWWDVELEEGAHTFTVSAPDAGARAYGVVLERDGPGVVWDSMAQVGAFTNRLSEFDGEHLKSQLAHREPALVVLMFGGNDMIRNMRMSRYVKEYRAVIQHLKAARPEMDCLIMSPLDHAKREGVEVVSKPIVPRMVAAQRKVAEAEGCAFFNTYEAMGGKGSAGRWNARKPRLMAGDLSHATRAGQKVLAEFFYRALMRRYAEFRRGE